MNFERPLFLWIFAALAPIAVAFLVRRKRPRVVVPDLEAWLAAAAPRRAMPGWRAVRNAASLLLNMAAAAALALAAAGPRAATPPGNDWALVLDVSASMSARDGRWQKAVEGADAFARSLPDRDRFRVFLAGESPRALGGWRDGGSPLPALPGPDEMSGDVAGTLALAKRDPAVRPGALKTVVWSDRASDADFAPKISSEAENVEVEAIDAARAWGAPEVNIVLRILNCGRLPATGTVAILCGTAKAEVSFAALAPGASTTLRTHVTAPDGGALEARLSSRDALDADDAAFAAVPPLRRALVLVVAPEAKSPFLSSSLASLGDALDPASGLVEPGKEKPGDLLIFDRCAPSAAPALTIAAPGDRPVVENPVVTAWAADHSLLRGLDLSRLRVARARPLARDPGATVLIDSVAGPLAVATRDGAALAFALEDSNLPLLAAFPLFVRNCVEELCRERPLPPVRIGDWEVPFEGGYDVWSAGETAPHAGPWRADRAGVVVFSQKGISRPLAVNFFNPAESALAAPPPGRDPPAAPRVPPPPWMWLAAGAALVLATEWMIVAKR
ncbi:MAG: VWA domain-containing protein [Planctomycetes bacterium]|nr:VWA domain-containing protein [Planctomycetota bacterium]